MKKAYKVLVYQIPSEYTVEAESVEEAEQKVISAEWPMIEEVHHIDSFRTCVECGYDNSPRADRCDECKVLLDNVQDHD